MPFYEYECESCKFYLETMQKISDAPLKKCPSCGKSTLKKLISAPNFRLKGSGWYETDFKSDNESKRNLAGADKEDAKPAETASGEKAKETPAKESKPAESKPAAASKRKPAKAPARKPAKAAARPARAKSQKAAKRKARR